jgi:hypothetical protein
VARFHRKTSSECRRLLLWSAHLEWEGGVVRGESHVREGAGLPGIHGVGHVGSFVLLSLVEDCWRMLSVLRYVSSSASLQLSSLPGLHGMPGFAVVG